MQPIFVGDVQGCAEELGELLARARASHPEGFEAWLVGDLVNRGPSNLAVLRCVRELVDAGRARYVLGNHEIGLLMTAAGLREQKPLDSFGDVLGASDAAEWLEWLRRRPLLEVGQLGRQRFAMVHAAVHPDWSLEELERRVRRVEARLARAGSPRGHRVARRGSGPRRGSGSARPRHAVPQRHGGGRLVAGAAGRRARGLAPPLVGARP